MIVGDGTLKLQLQQHARLSGVEQRVVFAGFHRNFIDLYSLMDISVLSLLREGTPMALLEVMAMGVQVIAADVGGVSQIICPDHNGILVTSHDPKAMSDAILRLLTNHDESARSAINGRNTVAKQYSAERMARDYETICSNILAGSHR